MAASKDSERLFALYRTMLLVRQAETPLTKLFADGEVPGFIHLSVGQEAIAAGVTSALAPGDTLATTHRGHGHVLARGLALDGFFKEIMGRAGGICQGRGGSMHVADTSLGILGANGIVGAGIPIDRVPFFECAHGAEALGAAAGAYLLALSDRPTAVLAMSDRLALAAELGATHTINSSAEDALAEGAAWFDRLYQKEQIGRAHV